MSVDVLAAVEAHGPGAHPDPIDLAGILGSGWRTAHNTRTGILAGSAFAVRRRGPVRLRRSRLRVLSTPAPGLGWRYLRSSIIRTADDTIRAVAVVHFPLRHTGHQGQALAEVRQWIAEQRLAGRPWRVEGDVNMKPALFAQLIGAAHHIGTDVMVAAWSTTWGPYRSEFRRAGDVDGTDHGVLFTTYTALPGRPTFATANMAFPNPANRALIRDILTNGRRYRVLDKLGRR